MKLSKFDLEKRMSIADMKMIKAGCAETWSGGGHCTSSGSDSETNGSEYDH
ncbi:MAG: hypothetical protein P4L34_10885 [Paludibacter sp.]|nr:hypothetical protein [Paludibacter sp.]